MRIDQMRQIVEVCASGSINKASQILFISQSSLSASIRAAEDELGQKILDRSHKGISLTHFGSSFVETAYLILKLYDEVLSRASSSEDGKLHISSQFLRYSSSIFASMYAEYEGTVASFRFTEKTRGGVLQDLLNRSSEIGIIVTPTEFRPRCLEMMEVSGLDYHIINTDPCRCIVGKGSPLYTQPQDFITMEQMRPFPQIRYERDGGLWEKNDLQEGDDYFPHTGLLVISDSGSFQNILTRTNGFFVGIHNKAAYDMTGYYDNIRVLSIKDREFPYDTAWMRLKNQPLTRLSKEFLRRMYAAVGKDPAEALQQL